MIIKKKTKGLSDRQPASKRAKNNRLFFKNKAVIFSFTAYKTPID